MNKPLYKHRNGQWCKRILGKIYYFGTDEDQAIAAYLAAKDSLYAGRGKPVESEEAKLYQLANIYYAKRAELLITGELSKRSLDDEDKTIQKLIGIVGRESVPSRWGPLDFQKIRLELFKPVPRKKKTGGRVARAGRRSHATVNGDIRRIKVFLNWCARAKYIPRPDFGGEFSESKARTYRLEKIASNAGPIPKESLLSILSHCNEYLLPVVMLGINCGMGAMDISSLTLKQLSGGEWLDCPRLKTGAKRRCWLWPETRKAIAKYLKLRKAPPAEQLAEIALLTMHRHQWVRHGHDAATQMFSKARKEAGLTRGSFYDLRRTFQTIGDETMDFPAVTFCMGHIPPASDMSSKYREVSDERVKRVCEHVRKWLYSIP